MRFLRNVVAYLAVPLAVGSAVAQLLPLNSPGTTSDLPPTPPVTGVPQFLAPAPAPANPVRTPAQNRPTVVNPSVAGRPTPNVPLVQSYQRPPELSALTFDATTKEYTAKPGELVARISYAVTNTSGGDVTINWVRPSCGCTLAKLPQPTPWKLAPGEGGVMDFDLDLRGKYGMLSKYISVDTSHGQKLLNFRVTVPSNTALPGVDQRTQNMRLAMADRQVVFKGDCAKCHVEPGIGQKGEKLYAASCGICHDAPNRATMVPDLHALKFVPTKEYWQQWVVNGKAGSLMPAFGQVHGGPLTQEQVDSLVEYLTHYFPPRRGVAAATPAAED